MIFSDKYIFEICFFVMQYQFIEKVSMPLEMGLMLFELRDSFTIPTSISYRFA